MGSATFCRPVASPGVAWFACWLISGCAGVNQAPSVAEIDIEPAIPHTLDNLRLVITEPSIDPDGDALVYHTRWFQDGEIRDRVHGDVVPASRTQEGEYWIAELWASDGFLDSPVAEATAYVFNTAPEGIVRLGPAAPTTSDNLVARTESSDLDGHEVEFEFSWSVDGVATEHTGSRVPAADTARDQRWAVQATPYDGDTWGQESAAETVIENSAPGVPTLSFSPEAPRAGRDDFQCVVLDPASDPDGDDLEYHVEWFLDGEPFEDATDTELEGDTIPASASARRQRWECRVRADDGDIEGNPARARMDL